MINRFVVIGFVLALSIPVGWADDGTPPAGDRIRMESSQSDTKGAQEQSKASAGDSKRVLREARLSNPPMAGDAVDKLKGARADAAPLSDKSPENKDADKKRRIEVAQTDSKKQSHQAGATVSDAFCRSIQQKPQEQFIRSNYIRNYKKMRAWLEYRTRQYGYFKGKGNKKWNKRSPRQNARKTTFLDRPVRLNKRIIPALKCVERDIRRTCQDGKCTPKTGEYAGECELKHKKFPYQPKRLSGIRYRNSFKGSEVSNHVYGIAIDLDPSENTCCKCVARWRNHRLCKRKDLKHPWQRMIMPVCFIGQFEKYGFYWLGRDRLEDTMHFEFLGRPELIEEHLK